MHIPASSTQKLSILSFEDALSNSGKSSDYDPEKWLYVPDFYTEYRYILGRRGGRPLICVGVNPSTAAPDDLDNTLKSVDRISRSNGFDGFFMLNLYAQRATSPDDMDRVFNEDLHRENMGALRYLLRECVPAPACVWAAWGSVIEKRSYLRRCAEDMIRVGRECGACWVTSGARSKKGHPHHPLYLKKDSPLDPFDDISAYCSSLS